MKKKRESWQIEKKLYWCPVCNVPLIGTVCGICSAKGNRVTHSPPGEFRPASAMFIEEFEKLLHGKYGIAIDLSTHGIVLNKIGGTDRTDEVIIDGYNIGIYYYDIEQGAHRYRPSKEGAMIFARISSKGKLEIHHQNNIHIKNNWLTMDHVAKTDQTELQDEEWIFIMSERGAGVGVYHHNKGIKVKEFTQERAYLSSAKFTRKKLAEANKKMIEQLKEKAIGELYTIIEEYRDKPFTVALSGGKDSLVASHLLYTTHHPFDVVYIDTGIEFRENKQYAEKISKMYNAYLHVADAKNAFNENFPKFGPPGKDFRWCCKVAKLGPVTTLIKEKYPHGSVSIEGRRWLESYDRSEIGIKEKNPFVPNQVQVNPIRSWNAMEVWLYIYTYDLPYNPLYEMDFERLGCYMCPASMESEYAHVKKFFPELSQQWNEQLEKWRSKNGFPDVYITKGLWRWKKLPPKMKAYESILKTDKSKKDGNELALEFNEPVITCESGNMWTLSGNIRIPDRFGFESSANGLQILGKVNFSKEFNVVLVEGRHGKKGTVFANGDITVTAERREDSKLFFERIVKQIVRVQMCTKCNICLNKCPKGAITIDETIRINGDLCTRCGLCEDGCVLALYYNKLFM